ncbi:hypothetical protein DYB30_001076 [Aphanomyces astaci]|uniref:Uncharacterized protein n=1 Tax=Aphanomyces astaci TaxID=112090 RepID=A0A397DJX1_APHAT|nr:hypothetical protein DYB30_001076 [Aphanomyces astaci]
MERKLLMRDDVPKHLLASMQLHVGDAATQSHGLQALYPLAFDAPHRVQLAACGSLPLCVSAMAAHPTVLPLQQHGCRFLQLMAFDDDCKVAILTHDGLPVVLAALDRFYKDKDLAISSSDLLYFLVADLDGDDDKMQGGIAPAIIHAVVRVMDLHGSDARIQSHGVAILNSLVANDAAKPLLCTDAVLDVVEQAIGFTDDATIDSIVLLFELFQDTTCQTLIVNNAPTTSRYPHVTSSPNASTSHVLDTPALSSLPPMSKVGLPFGAAPTIAARHDSNAVREVRTELEATRVALVDASKAIEYERAKVRKVIFNYKLMKRRLADQHKLLCVHNERSVADAEIHDTLLQRVRYLESALEDAHRSWSNERNMRVELENELSKGAVALATAQKALEDQRPPIVRERTVPEVRFLDAQRSVQQLTGDKLILEEAVKVAQDGLASAPAMVSDVDVILNKVLAVAHENKLKARRRKDYEFSSCPQRPNFGKLRHRYFSRNLFCEAVTLVGAKKYPYLDNTTTMLREVILTFLSPYGTAIECRGGDVQLLVTSYDPFNFLKIMMEQLHRSYHSPVSTADNDQPQRKFANEPILQAMLEMVPVLQREQKPLKVNFAVDFEVIPAFLDRLAVKRLYKDILTFFKTFLAMYKGFPCPPDKKKYVAFYMTLGRLAVEIFKDKRDYDMPESQVRL